MRVSVGDVRLFFEVSGVEWLLGQDGMRRRPVLIGLHGGPGLDGTKMRYQLASLADTMQVVVPDQRGHGRSDLGTSVSWNLRGAMSSAACIQYSLFRNKYGTSRRNRKRGTDSSAAHSGSIV